MVRAIQRGIAIVSNLIVGCLMIGLIFSGGDV